MGSSEFTTPVMKSYSPETRINYAAWLQFYLSKKIAATSSSYPACADKFIKTNYKICEKIISLAQKNKKNRL